jgi:hypothetical protein
MQWQIRFKIDAAAFAVGVFAFLYLAEGMRLFAGHSWWYVLTWGIAAGLPAQDAGAFAQGNVVAVVGEVPD